MWNPDGAKHAVIDLSTASSSSSSALLSSIRAERQAREHQRALEAAATTVQRVYRGRKGARTARDELITRLERGEAGVRAGVGALLLLLPRAAPAPASASAPMPSAESSDRSDRARVAPIVQAWCAAALQNNEFARPLATDADYVYALAVLLVRILEFVAASPRTAVSASLLTSLEDLLTPRAYAGADLHTRAELRDALGRLGWVETGISMLEALVAASPPKKKHPLLVPVVRLLLAPLDVAPLALTDPPSPYLAPLLQTLLAVPALPSSIPLQSLTYLSSALPLFSTLLPAAAAEPTLLAGGRLAEEAGRMCFLANLATFGITGGMLQRHGVAGTEAWIRVVGAMLGSLSAGWGRWAEGAPDAVPAVEESDSDDDAGKPGSGSRSRTPARPVLPPAVSSRLLLLASPAHLSTLVGFVVSTAKPDLMSGFSAFVLGILYAFRGSSRWEGTLDALLDGKRGRALVKLLWREGVRNRWPTGAEPSAAEAWDTFTKNSDRHALLLLSQIYCHYLLITPDDEFFDPQVNPLLVDEVLDLSLVWRNLAFWGYMNGVSGAVVGPAARASQSRAGAEEDRSLFTRGVTRVSERNARRKFAHDGYWVMPVDAQGFVQAVKYEEEELEQGEAGVVPTGPRHLTRRQIAYLSPRLGLLNNLSMAVPFQTRVEVFREFIKSDRRRHGLTLDNYGYRRNSHRVDIRRTHLAEDGFKKLNRLGPGLKSLVQITFIDQWGNEEEGIDGGGLFKEFLTALSKEAFDTERGLWLSNYNNELYPNPHSYARESDQLQWYSFLGRVLGKALYEDILVDVSFAGFFLAKWLSRQSYLDDLASLDKDLYRGLIMLKNYPGNPEDLSLNFTVTEDDFGVAQSIELVPGGSELAVTSDNRHEYIQLVCRYKLDRQFREQSRAFFSGLSDIIDPKWLRMFDQQELAQLLGGEESPIDIGDLRQHTTVTGFNDGATVQMFWRVVLGFSQAQRRALIRFVTSCSRPPLLGFAYLNPGFAIRNSGEDKERLPTASSCANLLKLPDYKDEHILRRKLLQAINSGAGFDMS